MSSLCSAGLGERLAATHVALAGRPALGGPATALEFLHDGDKPLVFQVQREDRPHTRRLVLVDDQFVALGVHVVAQDVVAAATICPCGGRRRSCRGSARR